MVAAVQVAADWSSVNQEARLDDAIDLLGGQLEPLCGARWQDSCPGEHFRLGLCPMEKAAFLPPLANIYTAGKTT